MSTSKQAEFIDMDPDDDCPPPPYSECIRPWEEQNLVPANMTSPPSQENARTPAQTSMVQDPPQQAGQVVIHVIEAASSPTEEVRNLMCLAILAAVFCFFPTGIIAVMKASEAKSCMIDGRPIRANRATLRARKCIRISIGLGIVFYILIILACICVPTVLYDVFFKEKES